MTFNPKLKILFFFSIALLVSGMSYAEIYKWVDENGVVHFTDNKENIPIILLDRVEEMNIGNDNRNDMGRKKEVDDGLKGIIFKKDDDGFDGIAFGTALDEFLSENADAALVSEDKKEKTYKIGTGNRRIGSVKIEVLYSFNSDELTGVSMTYDDSDEKKLIENLISAIGKPDFKRHPFLYWINDTIERRIRKDEDTFHVFRKKIKNF